MKSRTKKNAIRTRISPASAVSVQRTSGSTRRERGDRSRTNRPPPWIWMLPASISVRSADRRAVALQRGDLGLRLAEDVRRERRVLEVRRDLLAVAERVVEPGLDELGLALADARLAHVLVNEQERGGGDRVRGRVRRVDGAEPQVGRHLQALAGGGRRVQRRGHVLAGRVLEVGEREVVLERVGLLDVAERAVVLLHACGDAVVALGACADRPLDGLVDARAVRPLRAVRAQVGEEQLRGAGLVGAVADGDVLVGQAGAGVLAADLGVVPLLDLAEED